MYGRLPHISSRIPLAPPFGVDFCRVDRNRPRETVRFDDYCRPHYAWYHLARALLLQGRLEQANEALEQSLAHRPRYRPALRLRRLLQALELHAA